MGFSDWWQHTINDPLNGRRSWGDVADEAVDSFKDWGQRNVNEPLKRAAKNPVVIAGVVVAGVLLLSAVVNRN